MSQPKAYAPIHEFTADETANPNFPGSELDIELNALKTTTDQIRTNLALVQRDDGALKNGVVTTDSLDTTLAAALGDVAAIAEVEALIASAEADAVATAADRVAVAADLVLTDADTVATAADRVQTGLDAVATAADRVQTGLDVVATGADLDLTNADVVLTHADVVLTAADRVQTGLDAVDTAADRVQTGLDAATATTQAGLAQAAATAAAGSLDSFDDRYLGAKAADPTLDNDGNALLTGALYWNTSTGLKFYDGAAWGLYSAIAALMAVVDDTTPQLGGDLDLNGHDIIGLSSSDSPRFAGVNIGHASDTPITRASAGDIAVNGNIVHRAGGTDVAIADGGTGASTAQAAMAALKGVYILGASAAASGMSVTGSTSETTLATISVPANAMGANGVLRITVQWAMTGTADAKTGRIKFNGTEFNAGSFVAANLSGRTQTQIANRNSTSSQVGTAAAQANFTGTSSAAVTSAHDTTGALNITLTGQLNNGTDSIAVASYLVELLAP